MKVVVKIVGDGAQVEVAAGTTPRYLERREMAHMLAWAEHGGQVTARITNIEMTAHGAVITYDTV